MKTINLTKILNARDAGLDITEMTAPLQEALDLIQKRSRTRTVTVDEIIDKVEEIDRKLPISKKAKKGCYCSFDLNAQAFPSCYKGIPESTIVAIAYSSTGWIIYDIHRGQTRRPTVSTRMELTDEAKAAIIASYELF